jgi:hypothetical protein
MPISEEIKKELILKIRGFRSNFNSLLPSTIPSRLFITREDYKQLKKTDADFRKEAMLLEESIEDKITSDVMENIANSDFNHNQAKFILQAQFGWTDKITEDNVGALSEQDKAALDKAKEVLDRLRKENEKPY